MTGLRRRLVAAVAAGAAAATVAACGGTEEPDEAAEGPGSTAKVERRDLERSEELDGTLTYGEVRTLTGTVPGTVTWLPEAGAVVAAGEALYDVDNRPIVLMDGVLPMWRDLAWGVQGPDVEQLEENLAALGYGGFTVDEEFTGKTAEAVRAWQEDIGAAQTGAVALGEVVFAPGPVRVAEHPAAVGSPANGPVLAYTGRDQHVTVELEVTDQDLAEEGLAVTVRLPDGTEAAGEVSQVGAVVSAPPSQDGQESSVQDGTIEVTVALADPAEAGGLESAPVKVEFVADVHESVLVVPVEALLALREGGYGLEVVDGAESSIVPVETGLFASGLVEVSGADLAEGMTVVVPE